MDRVIEKLQEKWAQHDPIARLERKYGSNTGPIARATRPLGFNKLQRLREVKLPPQLRSLLDKGGTSKLNAAEIIARIVLQERLLVDKVATPD